MEKRAKYAKIHPEMSNLDLTKILSKKYKELPDKKKVGTRCGWLADSVSADRPTRFRRSQILMFDSYFLIRKKNLNEIQ